ncbi:MAG: hypothetical protein U5N85_16685 [Arcicella sp.]|nr:hypothetical protein [Arcicella sp.]
MFLNDNRNRKLQLSKKAYGNKQHFAVLIKIVAWYLTNSVAILTDALEYTINVISGVVQTHLKNTSPRHSHVTRGITPTGMAK